MKKPLLIIAAILSLSILFTMYINGTVKYYVNSQDNRHYKLFYPSTYFDLIEDFDEYDGLTRNCIRLNFKSHNSSVGISIQKDHHPCYLRTGSRVESVKAEYEVSSQNTTFKVVEKVETWGEKTEEQLVLNTLFAEDINSNLFIVYSDTEASFLKNKDLILQIISSIEWLN